MNSFRTSLELVESNQKIDLKHKILTIGSCFSDVIGNYLSDYKFDVLSNPFGTVYNPISIFNYLNGLGFNNEHYAELHNYFYHLDVHSKFFASDKLTLKKSLEAQNKEFTEYFKSADWLIITLGTSFVYSYNKTEKIVANCHKIPQKEFTKRVLSLDEIKTSFQITLETIKKINPDLKILLTVSPVRHTKDGIEENSTSKALLRVFCNEACNENGGVNYFPSYEIMMDDLRDYRFYKPDMIHPNEVAEEYIWEFFQKTFFHEDTKKFITEWSKILSAMQHKPFNFSSEAHQKFLKSNISKLDRFSRLMDVSEEKKFFESQMNKY